MARLRFGLVAIATWFPAEALAEICDKGAGGDAWMPQHGPVWLLNPVGWPIGLIILLAWLVLSVRGPRWFGYAGVALLAAFVGVSLLDVVSQHDVYRMQVEEGCKSLMTDWADIGLLLVFATAYAALGYRRYRADGARIRLETDI